MKFPDRNILFKRGQAVPRNLFPVTRPAGSPFPVTARTRYPFRRLRPRCRVARSFRRGGELGRCPASRRRAFFNPAADETRGKGARDPTPRNPSPSRAAARSKGAAKKMKIADGRAEKLKIARHVPRRRQLHYNRRNERTISFHGPTSRTIQTRFSFRARRFDRAPLFRHADTRTHA